MRRWRSSSIAFAEALRELISSGIENQNAAASPSALATAHSGEGDHAVRRVVTT
jgi:hypothetical protein